MQTYCYSIRRLIVVFNATLSLVVSPTYSHSQTGRYRKQSFYRKILFLYYSRMAVDDELSTPILHSDDDETTNRRRFRDDELEHGASGCGACCCNPTSGCHRFIALILMCLVGFGEYFPVRLVQL